MTTSEPSPRARELLMNVMGVLSIGSLAMLMTNRVRHAEVFSFEASMHGLFFAFICLFTSAALHPPKRRDESNDETAGEEDTLE